MLDYLKQVKYGNEIYNNLGLISINNSLFLLIINQDKIIALNNVYINEISKSYKLFNANINDLLILITEKVKTLIMSDKFHDKASMIEYFLNLSNFIDFNGAKIDLRDITGINNELDNFLFNLSNFFEDYLNKNNQINEEQENKNIEYTPYEEQTVTDFLNSNIGKNIEKFIEVYMNDFTIEQIDLILGNYLINEEMKKTLLNNKKRLQKEHNLGARDVINFKPKVLVKKKNNNPTNLNAAFVDVFLLSFIIGVLSGIYAIFLVIAILS